MQEIHTNPTFGHVPVWGKGLGHSATEQQQRKRLRPLHLTSAGLSLSGPSTAQVASDLAL